MNEIERIEEVMQIIKIRHMLEYIDGDVTQQDIVEYKERFSALKSARDALREKAERNKGCVWCDVVKFGKYCPNCGTKMEGKQDE